MLGVKHTMVQTLKYIALLYKKFPAMLDGHMESLSKQNPS